MVAPDVVKGGRVRSGIPAILVTLGLDDDINNGDDGPIDDGDDKFVDAY